MVAAGGTGHLDAVHPVTVIVPVRFGPVLIEFWTFACGNCVHTLPFMQQMSARYRERLTVIGVHTPELPFERSRSNVERAVRQRRLTYPIALDDEFAAWNAFGNRYWPTLYLIDAEGHIRHVQIGEGRYRRTEAAIQRLLVDAPELAHS
jgi:thiol-disulfide isomerase/thioredoxin